MDAIIKNDVNLSCVMPWYKDKDMFMRIDKSCDLIKRLIRIKPTSSLCGEFENKHEFEVLQMCFSKSFRVN